MSNDARPRLACPDSACGFVFWDNPVPVVAYHLRAEGAITLNGELDAFKIIPAAQLGGYDFGPLILTRRLIDDWLAT